MYGNVAQRSAPGAEPISLVEAKLHCRVDSDFTDDDVLIKGLISSARGHVESVTGRLLVLRLLRATFPALPCTLEMKTPAREVLGISYLDGEGESKVLDSNLYVSDLAELPATIYQAFDSSWPMTYQHPAAVTLDYSAGYAVPFTVTTATDTINAPNHPFSDGDTLRVVNSGGTLPTGLTVDTTYYAIDSGVGSLKLAAAEGGPAIDISAAGSGTNFLLTEDDSEWTALRQAMLLLIGHWYSNREAVNTGNISTNLPLTVDALLSPHKVWGV